MNAREQAIAWLLGTLAMLLSIALVLWLLMWPAVFRLYYTALKVSPHTDDAAAIVQWLSSQHRERSLNLALVHGQLTIKELKHYSDVRRVIQWLPRVTAGLGIFTIFLVLATKPSLKVLAAAQLRALIGWLLLLVILGGAAYYDWKAFFALLHQPLFGERSWRLPKSSYSLHLFPAAFWQVSTALVLLTPGVLLAISGLQIRRLRARTAPANPSVSLPR